MKQAPQASEPTISRLAYYLRAVSHLAATGCMLVSSQILATRLGVSSAQVRKDLSCFGEFGTQAQGYPVLALRDQLLSILHVDHFWPVAVVGAGKVGRHWPVMMACARAAFALRRSLITMLLRSVRLLASCAFVAPAT